VCAHQITSVRQIVKGFHGASIEGVVCNVIITIAGREFHRTAVAIPGDLMDWTPCFHVPYEPTSDMDFVLKEMGKKFKLPEEDRRYLPPTMKDGFLAHGE